VTDVKNPHAITEDSIENLIWIPNERHYAHARPIRHRWRALGVFPNVDHDLAYARLHGRGNRISKSETVRRNFAKVGNGASGKFDLHARRKL
jgi:hypothetical protein